MARQDAFACEETMNTLLTFTDEKLEEYLGIWNKLISSDYRSQMDVTLQMDYVWPPISTRYTLTYGEERRELTFEQALRVKEWLEQIARLP